MRAIVAVTVVLLGLTTAAVWGAPHGTPDAPPPQGFGTGEVVYVGSELEWYPVLSAPDRNGWREVRWHVRRKILVTRRYRQAAPPGSVPGYYYDLVPTWYTEDGRERARSYPAGVAAPPRNQASRP